jgi:hypothetical protein
MIAAMCKGGHHEYCSERVKQPSGKVFQCTCSCHDEQRAARARRAAALRREESDEEYDA